MKDNKKEYKRIIVLLIFVIIILFSLLLFKSCKKDEATNSPVSTTEIETTTEIEKLNTDIIDESTATETTTQKHSGVNKKPALTITTETTKKETETSTTEKESTTNINSSSTAIPGYEVIYLKADTKQQNIALENPSQNRCYFKITLLLEDGTVLWKSDLIKPGKKSEAIYLTQEMQRGNYKAILKYECYSMDGKMKPMNGAETKLSLRVN
ncbi:MAG: hypothetical protein IKB36_00600 [Clostridia bacterium]|nr:hypothetical protein [Clostridia bacterium]